ncbi:MAG: asparagine synthase (glutamine-hydrolyzing) [Ferruginibacter sp.]
MCRISGIINREQPASRLFDQVKAMCTLQAHGGPDGEGIYQEESQHLVLGHRRLALLDLSPAGAQPMHYGERYTISYNGEIYNFQSLKETLARLGHHFHNGTDTEVILAAFAQWHTQSFQKLQGMFAFALWDKQEKILYLVRDAAGIKPLYFHVHAEGLNFASEIQALESLDMATESPDWPVYLMAFGHIPRPLTTFKEIKPLPKGCFMAYNVPGKKYSLQSFEHFSFSEKATDGKEAASITEALTGAVERQMVADAPLGVFLSGGLDSSIITSLAASRSPQVNSISLHFGEDKYSEKKFQDLLVEKAGTRHHSNLLTEADFKESFPEILAAMDMPCCDGINTWFISKTAREQGLKAVLSGVGADELFGGYPSFRRIRTALFFQQQFRFGLHTGAKKIDRLAYLGLPGIKGIYLFLRGLYTPHDIARHLDCNEAEVWRILQAAPVWDEIDILHAKNQASWMEYHLYLQNQLLPDADIMGMAHGVEIRVPFLDSGLTRLAFGISPQVKFGGKLPKQILIDGFKNTLPEATWNRPKMGFTLPFASWLKNNAFAAELIASGGSEGQETFQRFIKGRVHWSQVMALLLVQYRQGRNFKGQQARA